MTRQVWELLSADAVKLRYGLSWSELEKLDFQRIQIGRGFRYDSREIEARLRKRPASKARIR